MRRAHATAYWLSLAASIGLAVGAAAVGCGGDDTNPTSGTGASGGSGGAGGTGATTSSSSSSSSTTGTGGTGGGTGGADAGPDLCVTTAGGPTRGSAIALTADEKRLIVVNRDTGNATVMSIEHATGVMTVVKDSTSSDQINLGAGSEPWSVAVNACGTKAYVVLRKDQKVVEINDLDGVPSKGAEVAVGSEPTGIAITPNNTKLFVTNWVDGTVTVIDTATMMKTATVDLNATLAATSLLGAGVAARASLAHPRALAITNNGDTNDDDELVYVTEWFAQRTAPESADGKNSDTNKQGLVYKIKISDSTASTIALPPVIDTGFNAAGNGAANNSVTGCFPNQVGAIAIENGFAYVTSTCASPVGPIGAFQKAACTANAQCTLPSTCDIPTGSCTGSCSADADCGFGSPAGTCVNPGALTGACKVNPNNFKTTTHPAVTVINIAAGTATTVNVDKLFVAKSSTRLPLLPTDIAFKPGTGFGYITGSGTDAVFRIKVDATGAIVDVGAASPFINLRTGVPADTEIRLPVGIAVSKNAVTAFSAHEGTREVTSIDLNAQAIFGAAGITSSAPMPGAGTPELASLKGKRFFNTGLGRWSLAGAGWGSCAACHVDGLTDNVTWYFARGPRQSVSLDGSFASADPNDQRIFNWTAIFDEVADFEGNVRGISGGVGATVKALSGPPPVNADRIDTAAAPPQQGLQGSSEKTADPATNPASLLNDWKEVNEWIKTIRSPRKPTNLVAADVAAGKLLFAAGQGNCVGCHSGAKWTISKRFYTPQISGAMNPTPATADASTFSLSNIAWNTNVNGFPAALFPADAAAITANQARMRFGAPPGAEQIQCILRPVGTIGAAAPIPAGVSPAGVNVVELRQDMVTGGQGAATNGRGFNPPSLLGVQVGAPYFHAGNARTLEEVFDNALFSQHHQSAIAQVFTVDATKVKQLVAYLLSIDESEPVIAIPALSASGGDLCHL